MKCEKCTRRAVAHLAHLSTCDADQTGFCVDHVDAALKNGFVDLVLYANLHEATLCCEGN